MLTDDTRSKIENITNGVILEGNADYCSTARNLLCSRYPTSTTVKKDFESQAIIKKEQAGLLERFANEQDFWLSQFPQKESFLTHGGEAQVYLDSDFRHVIKLNDAIYYATWLEYLNSILLHNFIFPNTSYELIGLAKVENNLIAALRQPFIISDAPAELDDIKKLLEYNGFETHVDMITNISNLV